MKTTAITELWVLASATGLMKKIMKFAVSVYGKRAISIPSRDLPKTAAPNINKIVHSTTQGVIGSNENRYNHNWLIGYDSHEFQQQFQQFYLKITHLLHQERRRKFF
jgi:hypothetical protein